MTAADLATVEVWIEDDEVVIRDRADIAPGRLHVRVVQMAWHSANQTDRARATVNGRSYHRDTLRAALDAVEALPACAGCGEAPGVRDMGDGTRRCVLCCAAAGGSRYDDKGDL